jgi:hypothetical protein
MMEAFPAAARCAGAAVDGAGLSAATAVAMGGLVLLSVLILANALWHEARGETAGVPPHARPPRSAAVQGDSARDA